MITIEKLMNDANTALCKHFTKIVNGVRIEPDVYDHTDEIYFDGEEGVSVWCEIPKGTLSFFNGAANSIINADEDMVLVSVFLGDKCIDAQTAEELSCRVDLGRWDVADIDDYLMICTNFSECVDLESELTERFADLLDEGFVDEIKELAACFK